MSNIFGILNIGKSALLTEQTAIDITGHNIANVNTDGYSSQSVSLQASLPVSSQAGELGTGVKAVAVLRDYDCYLESQIQGETSELGRWEAQQYSFQRIEQLFDESSEYGLNQVMTDFWAAWQDLSNNPSGTTERMLVLSLIHI